MRGPGALLLVLVPLSLLAMIFGAWYAGSAFSLSVMLVVISIALTIQGAFTIYWMIYSWENTEKLRHTRSPAVYDEPTRSFSALIPARHEEDVIIDTLEAVDRIDYPGELKEAFVICRSDDTGTIETVERWLEETGSSIELVVFDGLPINKPKGLNEGLERATGDVVVIFDAEDEPHEDIYRIVDTVMTRDDADVVQSGVQLMNYRSHWFSSLNVLEYFFWFKSALHLFAKLGMAPLGGNTVFFKRDHLERIGGWDEDCLTEDADVGVRLSSQGAKISIVYDHVHCTREETPASVGGFVKQRTRWNQGFLQILLKGDWRSLDSRRKRLVAFYILSWTQVQGFLFLYLPIAFTLLFFLDLPVLVALLAQLPLYLLALQLGVNIIGLREFTHEYGLDFNMLDVLRIVLAFIPYNLLLSVAALRANLHLLIGRTSWEKTAHTNAHRTEVPVGVGK